MTEIYLHFTMRVFTYRSQAETWAVDQPIGRVCSHPLPGGKERGDISPPPPLPPPTLRTDERASSYSMLEEVGAPQLYDACGINRPFENMHD